MRSPYTTNMRFYTDTDVETRVVWYRVSRDAPWLPYPTPFHDADWDEENPPGRRRPGTIFLGEQLDAPRTYASVRTIPPRPIPAFFCGKQEQWLNGTPLPPVPPTPLSPDGYPVCCGLPAEAPFPPFNTCLTLWRLAQVLDAQYTSAATAIAFTTLFPDFFPPNVLYSTDNGPTLLPGIIIIGNRNVTMVFISGTTNLKQWVGQLMSVNGIPSFTTPNRNAYGTSQLWQTLAIVLGTAITANCPQGVPILMTGHSMGGSLASVISAQLTDRPDPYDVTTVLFEAPKAGDARLQTIVTRNVTNTISIVNDGDPFPRLPPNFAGFVIPPPFNVYLGVWNQYVSNNETFGLTATGIIYAGPSDSVYLAFVGAIFSALWSSNPIPGYIAHGTTELVRRLALQNCGGNVEAPVIYFNMVTLHPLPNLHFTGQFILDVPPHQYDLDVDGLGFAFILGYGTPPSGVALVNDSLNTVKPSWEVYPPFTYFIVFGAKVPGFSVLAPYTPSPTTRVTWSEWPNFNSIQATDGQIETTVGGQTLFVSTYGLTIYPSFNLLMIRVDQYGSAEWYLNGLKFLCSPVDPTVSTGDNILRPQPPTGSQLATFCTFGVLYAVQQWLSDSDANSLAASWANDYTGDPDAFAIPSGEQECPMPSGVVVDFAGTSAPGGWLLCDGTAYSGTDYPSLFVVLGTLWNTFRGQADPGSGSFRVPLLNGLATAGVGPSAPSPPTSMRAFQDVLGEEEHTLVLSEISGHTHGVNDPQHYHAPYPPTPTSNFARSYPPALNGVQNLIPGGTSVYPGSSITSPASTGITITNSGGDGPHNNIQPTVFLNKIIKA